jgi:hypothetical protein
VVEELAHRNEGHGGLAKWGGRASPYRFCPR